MSDGYETALNVIKTLFAALNNPHVQLLLSDIQGLRDQVSTVNSVLLDADITEVDYIQKLKDDIYDVNDLIDKFFTLAELKGQLRAGDCSEKVRHFFSSRNPVIVAYSMSQGVKKISKKFKDIADDHATFKANLDTQHLKTVRVETQAYVHVDKFIGREDDTREIIGRLLNSSTKKKKDLEALKHTVETLNSVLVEADHNNCERGKDYIQIVKDALYDADDLFDKLVTQAKLKEQLRDGDCFEKVRRLFSSKNPLIAAWSASRDVKSISNKLSVIAAANADRFTFRFDPLPIRRRREETCPYVYDNKVIGREDDAREIVGRLLNSTDDVGFLSIVGMGGFGKTTLAQLVYHDELIKSGFELRLWVCVSDHDGAKLDVKQILSNILENCGFESVNTFPMEQVQQEYIRNLGGKKLLMVLDDVWTENREEWLNLREFLMMGGKGSRIIVTTRSKETANIIGNDTHQLGGLSEENAWRLFTMEAFAEESIHDDFVDIGKKIVKRCSNVPLTIRVMGTLLYGQSIAKWHKMDELGELNSGDNPIMPILKLSYDCLEPSLKSCFSYCALFPKDYVIKKVVLLTLWEAQGYIIPFEEGQSIEDACEEHFTILLQKCFFQDVKMNEDGGVESFKMHDLMHDLAQSVSGKGVRIINSSVPIVDTSVRHLFDTTLIKEDDFIIHSKIRSYLMFRKRWSYEARSDSLPFPLSKIAKKQCCLRALALQGLRVSSLPDTIGNLLHLRYLNLAKNSMKKLPNSIAKLHNLQTLNINKCDELKEWPKEFSKLANLKYLYREKCYELRCMPVGMSKLTSLRVLTDFVVEDESVGGMKHVGQLKDLKALSANLQNRLSIQFHVSFTGSEGYDWEGSCLEGAEHLKEVEIGFSFPSHVLYQRRMDEEKGAKEEAVMEKLRPHTNLRKFMLSHYAGSKIKSWGRAQDNWAETSYLPNLVHIKLSNCHRLQQLPLLSKLLHLKSLYLFELKNLKFVEESAITGDLGSSGPRSLDTTFFPSLESLEILELKSLKGWWRSCYSSQSHHQLAFPSLSQLTIENCPQLTSFPPCLSHPKLDLRNNNKRLRIRTSDEAQTSSSSQPPHPICPCP